MIYLSIEWRNRYLILKGSKLFYSAVGCYHCLSIQFGAILNPMGNLISRMARSLLME
jgi:hypothetical protein